MHYTIYLFIFDCVYLTLCIELVQVFFSFFIHFIHRSSFFLSVLCVKWSKNWCGSGMDENITCCHIHQYKRNKTMMCDSTSAKYTQRKLLYKISATHRIQSFWIHSIPNTHFECMCVEHNITRYYNRNVIHNV